MKRGNKRKFGRERDQRNALMKALSTALISHERITTTKAKAKSLGRHMEKLLTLAKKRDLASRRLLTSQVGQQAVKKLTNEIAPRFLNTRGGYTRIINQQRRKSDGAPMAIVEFTQSLKSDAESPKPTH